MPARKPAKGEAYTFQGLDRETAIVLRMPVPPAPDEGEDTTRYAIGVDASALLPGTVVEVREVVKATTTGAHNGDEDAVVITWEAEALGRGEGGPELVTVERALSIGLTDRGNLPAFSKLFELVEGG